MFYFVCFHYQHFSSYQYQSLRMIMQQTVVKRAFSKKKNYKIVFDMETIEFEISANLQAGNIMSIMNRKSYQSVKLLGEKENAKTENNTKVSL